MPFNSRREMRNGTISSAGSRGGGRGADRANGNAGGGGAGVFPLSLFGVGRRPANGGAVTKEQLDEHLEQQSGLLKESLNKSYQAALNAGEEDEMLLSGYRRSIGRTALTWACFILTAGLLRLFMHWWKHWLLLATHKPCSLDIAEKVLITEHYEGKHTLHYVKEVVTLNAETLASMEAEPQRWGDYVPLGRCNGPLQMALHFSGGLFKPTDSLRLFKCKQLRYVWDEEHGRFCKLKGLDTNVPSVQLHQHQGLTTDEQFARRLVYGANTIYIPLKSVMTLLFLEALNPFYVFQVFSVILWFSYNYYYYAVVIVLMTGFGVTMSIIQTRKNQLALYRTVTSTDSATVIGSDGTAHEVETKYLVPGDILEIPSSGCTMNCDAALLSGNCILDESMLTGESVPVTKTPMPCKRDLLFDQKEHARHVLFSGTKVIQTRYIGSEKVLAIVINTGNITAKGGLVRSILYPPPVDYKFEQDSYKFIAMLGVAAFVGFIYTLVTKISRGVSAGKIAIEALDLITIAVPPALPAAMTVGRFYAQKRLERNNIYCISPRSINVSGSIDCVCFDKTGTLTEDGLDMWGVVPKSSTNRFQIPLHQVSRLPYEHFLFGMVSCHSITIMGGELKGDPLDLKMFESTGWVLEEANVADDAKYDLLFPTMVRPPRNSGYMIAADDDTGDGTFGSHMDIGIVREFSFTSSLQRMSVITRKLLDPQFNVYCKGSPEMIETMCRPETVPVDFHATLEEYAQQGYRIIAIAYKQLDKRMTYAKVQRVAREKCECDLEFLGLVVMENRLKEDTTEIIGQLTAAAIRTVMVTGDNMLTALSVARDCGMVPKGQSVITVNARAHPDKVDKWELFYTLTGTAGSAKAPPTAGTPNGCGGDYALMTNSNSVASLDTTDTFTHNNTAPMDVDVEAGYFEPTEKGMPVNMDTGLIPELPCNNYRFALTGKTWQIIRDDYPELLPRIVTRGTIFARMSPDQKQALVLELQDVGYYVAMCGDGANDCGALKAAHTGISLSEAESSVASPFTSRRATIACVPLVIKEGRAALVTSVGIFKYMAAYSLVQFASVLILYSIDSNFTDVQFLFLDLFITSIIAFYFGKTESYEGPLVPQTPLSSLVSASPIASLVLHLLLAIGIQVLATVHLHAQSWYKPFVFVEESHLGCVENYVIFTLSCYQYITLAFVFSKGTPYRKSMLSNYGLLAAMLANTAISVFLTLGPPDNPIARFFQLVVPETFEFQVYIVLYALANLLISVFIEVYIIDHVFFKRLRYRFHNVEKSRRQFLSVENGMRRDPAWPPLSLYSNEATAGSVERELSAAGGGAGGQFAEICVEATGVDVGPPFAERNTSVLNSFFEARDVDEEAGGGGGGAGGRQMGLDMGLLEPIDEVDTGPQTAEVTPTPSPAASGSAHEITLNGVEEQLANGRDEAATTTAAAAVGTVQLPVKRTSTLVINLDAPLLAPLASGILVNGDAAAPGATGHWNGRDVNGSAANSS